MRRLFVGTNMIKEVTFLDEDLGQMGLLKTLNITDCYITLLRKLPLGLLICGISIQPFQNIRIIICRGSVMYLPQESLPFPCIMPFHMLNIMQIALIDITSIQIE